MSFSSRADYASVDTRQKAGALARLSENAELLMRRKRALYDNSPSAKDLIQKGFAYLTDQASAVFDPTGVDPQVATAYRPGSKPIVVAAQKSTFKPVGRAPT